MKFSREFIIDMSWRITKCYKYFQPVFGSGSEPKIVSTMTRKGYPYHSNHVSLFENPNAEEIVRGLIRQHKSRKNEDPVSVGFIISLQS